MNGLEAEIEKVVQEKYNVKKRGIYIPPCTPPGACIGFQDVSAQGGGKIKDPKGKVKYGFISTNLSTVRFADDFIVLARSKRMIEETIKPCVDNFLKQRGLLLSDEKTKILSIRNGDKLNFLGYTFQYIGEISRKYKLFNDRQGREAIACYPQKGKYEAIVEKLREMFTKGYNSSSYSLIAQANPVIRG